MGLVSCKDHPFQAGWFKREWFDEVLGQQVTVWDLDVPLAIEVGDVRDDLVSQLKYLLFPTSCFFTIYFPNNTNCQPRFGRKRCLWMPLLPLFLGFWKNKNQLSFGFHVSAQSKILDRGTSSRVTWLCYFGPYGWWYTTTGWTCWPACRGHCFICLQCTCFRVMTMFGFTSHGNNGKPHSVYIYIQWPRAPWGDARGWQPWWWWQWASEIGDGWGGEWSGDGWAPQGFIIIIQYLSLYKHLFLVLVCMLKTVSIKFWCRGRVLLLNRCLP